MDKLQALAEVGQAIWLDYIQRNLITSGELERWVARGLRGITSNPSIFEKAITGGADYDRQIEALAALDYAPVEICEILALEDIGQAADLLRPVYDETDGLDGYVSLEVDPALAHDSERTISEARRLFELLARPNVMIKVPATPAGIPAIEALIGQGINVNATLIFSLAQYEAVARAYLRGLERLQTISDDLSRVASVASFFISRVDTAVDRVLAEIGRESLQGRAAIANAQVAYGRFQVLFSGERWERLASLGGRVQRPLWASTSTKNPRYSDTLYIDGLIGPHTVNTVPPTTLDAFLDHGRVALTLTTDSRAAQAHLDRLGELGINLDTITTSLLKDGVAAFANSFDGLVARIADKAREFNTAYRLVESELGAFQGPVDDARAKLQHNRIIERIWAHDYTVWKPEPAGIIDRLGWLQAPETMPTNVDRLLSLVQSVRADGYTDVLLLGMGGSSLAPEVLRQTYGVGQDEDGPYLDLAVLDSTDPATVMAQAARLDPARTLLIVATKSGSTVETLSLFKFFYNWMVDALGHEQAGAHFIAITDPGSRLAELAGQHNFRATLLNDPHIGGRYSALSYFGLLPAALIGVDVRQLLGRAQAMAARCGAGGPTESMASPGLALGAILGALAEAGRDKVTLITSAGIASFGEWVEQLIAESTGKEGRGILPVVGEPLDDPETYGDDRLFVYLRLDRDAAPDAAVKRLKAAGHPVVTLRLSDPYDLGGQFLLWAMATAVTGHLLGISPFDQPNVEAAKVLARQMVAAYRDTGRLPSLEPSLTADGITIYGGEGGSLAEVMDCFLRYAQPGAYIALQAFLPPSSSLHSQLTGLAQALRRRTRLATTWGYGPRFLHSTGQLHKGDGGRGLFIQLTADGSSDVSIPDRPSSPDSSLTFGVLLAAQALGDRQALLDAGRQVVRFHLGDDIGRGLERLMKALA
jgi:transaldolase/glucose-6-phosphate isomerase